MQLTESTRVDGDQALNTENAVLQTPRSIFGGTTETVMETRRVTYSSPRQEYIKRMRESEEETAERLRNVLRKIKRAMSRQKNINMDVQNGISELEELVDIMGDYRKNWKSVEEEKVKNEIMAQDITPLTGEELVSSQKRPATSPPGAKRPTKVHKETKKKIDKAPSKRSDTHPEHLETGTTPAREPAKNKRTKHQRPKKERPEAIIIRPTSGHSYAEVLKNLKENVRPEESQVAVQSVRKTKAGAILLELEKGSKKDKFCELVSNSLEKVAVVKGLETKMTIEIRDIEGFSTKEDILAAVNKIIEGEIGIQVTKPNAFDQKRAFVSLSVKEAKKLLELERIKIGWTNCRLRYCETTKRCYRCFELGHAQWDCKGPDRKGMGLCIRCGEKGHVMKQCNNPPKCCLCVDGGKSSVSHIAGSKTCGST